MSTAPRPKATIYSVAQRAGVSISTVSLAVNAPHRVSEETRRKVLDAARLEGYRAPARSSGRAGSATRMVAVAAPFSSWPSYYQRLSGIMEVCAANGVSVTVHDLPASERSEAPILEALPVRESVDAIIVMGVPLSAEAEARLAADGPPAVVVDAQSDLPSIVSDDEHTGRILGRHLTELGHRTVLFAHRGQVSDAYISSGMQRSAGLTAALTSVGGRLIPQLVGESTDWAAALSSTGATAIAASQDALASEIVADLARQGVRVPCDVSVTGCDGDPVATALGITTAVQPFVDSGRAAASLVLELLDGQSPQVRRVVLGTQLRVGTTTSGPAGAGPESE